MVDAVLTSSLLGSAWGGKHQNGKSDGALFQLELDDTLASKDVTNGPQSLLDHGYTGATSVSTAFWQMEIDEEPETIEDVQKKLDAASEAMREDFLEFSRMSQAEKIRAQVLGEKALTEEQLAALSPEERAAIEEEIKQAILRALGVNQAKNGDETETTTAFTQ